MAEFDGTQAISFQPRAGAMRVTGGAVMCWA